MSFKANFKESYMAAFYDYFNEQKYADAVKNVSVWSLIFFHVSCIQWIFACQHTHDQIVF